MVDRAHSDERDKPGRLPGAEARRGARPLRDTSIDTYRVKRDFTVTREPVPAERPVTTGAPRFVIQKHHAHRAGLHWDFRLEHGGVLRSWVVRKGPSLDPADRRVAVHVEDHPIDYADFEGEIPEGQYGAGSVEIWDRGTWQPVGDPEEGMRKGDLKFVLHGTRLHGAWVLVRMRPRPGRRGRKDRWLLIKHHDDQERAGADAAVIERATPPPRPDLAAAAPPQTDPDDPPAPGARKARLSARQSPQLCAIAENPPGSDRWISEIKFDGYRLLAFIANGTAKLVTRGGHDWTDRLPSVAREVGKLNVRTALLDGELVALDRDGRSRFPALQAALADGRDATLHYYVFDLLHLNGWDLRDCKLLARKRTLSGLSDWRGMLRYSDHHVGDAVRVYQEACRMRLEGIICKRADAPYRAGRGHGWVKIKCLNREEFIVLGWTPPRGHRTGLGSLHLGYYDHDHRLHYAGGAGTGFSEDELVMLHERLADLAADSPRGLLASGDPLDPAIRWVRPELVAEIRFTGWSGAGRVRQAVYLGLREDKAAEEVARDIADPEADHKLVCARTARVEGVTLTHPDRELWPGITKQQLADYWQAVAAHALPGLARRPLAIVRCPKGIDGKRFFQKRGHGALPNGVRRGLVGTSPYLAIDGVLGLTAMAQISAIELHAWGATEYDPLHPDVMVFDLDPGDGVPFHHVVRAALDVRDRLQQLGLASFCRTTGGKGLHVVVPLAPEQDWDSVRSFCRAFAEMLSEERPDRFVSTIRKKDRRGRILIDWLRNQLGATAIASFCPRARHGATVATPLAWDEVTPKLDPQTFTLHTVSRRLIKLHTHAWQGFSNLQQHLPDAALESRAAQRRGDPH